LEKAKELKKTLGIFRTKHFWLSQKVKGMFHLKHFWLSSKVSKRDQVLSSETYDQLKESKRLKMS
jgi:hypothetical protein